MFNIHPQVLPHECWIHINRGRTLFNTRLTGHRCLLARVALYVPPDTYANSTVFDVRSDRHVAQLNISVVSLSDEDGLGFSFALSNPLEKPMQIRLIAREVRDANALEHIRESLGYRFAQFGDSLMPNVKLDLGPERLTIPQVENPMVLIDEVYRFTRSGIIDLPRLERPRNSLICDLQPGEMCEAMLYVERNPGTRKGDLHAINVIQYDDSGNIMGGITLVIQH